MNSPFNIKQGEPLYIGLQFTQDDGTPVNISGAELFSEIRDAMGNLVATPMLSVTNAALGMASYRALSDASWPIGRLRTDIVASFGGIAFITETTFIGVSAPVTRWVDAAA